MAATGMGMNTATRVEPRKAIEECVDDPSPLFCIEAAARGLEGHYYCIRRCINPLLETLDPSETNGLSQYRKVQSLENLLRQTDGSGESQLLGPCARQVSAAPCHLRWLSCSGVAFSFLKKLEVASSRMPQLKECVAP